MKSLIRWIARLYPAAWRTRYGAELEALIEDTNPRGKDVFDVLKGALKMQVFNSGFRITAACAIAGMLIAILGPYAWPKQYVSSAVLTVRDPGADVAADRVDLIQSLQQNVLSRTTLTTIIQSLGLYGREKSRMPPEDVVDRMRKKITIHPVQGPTEPFNSFAIEYSYDDPAKAQKTVAALITGFIDANLLSRSINPPGRQYGLRLEVTHPASMPMQPTYPNRALLIVLGLGAGVLISVCTLLVRRLRFS